MTRSLDDKDDDDTKEAEEAEPELSADSSWAVMVTDMGGGVMLSTVMCDGASMLEVKQRVAACEGTPVVAQQLFLAAAGAVADDSKRVGEAAGQAGLTGWLQQPHRQCYNL